MATMTSQGRNKAQINWRADWWLWPSAFLLAMGGWGQAIWMWENVRPTGLAPLWFLIWTGVGVAGLALPVYWFARRWWPFAWLAAAAWAGVPAVNDLATYRNHGEQAGGEWLHSASPLLLLLLLGVGLSGVIMGVAWPVRRRWSGSVSKLTPLREGAWSGLFVVVCGWLLIYRAFTLGAIALLAGALVLIEAFLVIRESSRKQGASRIA